jgi:hypothetical protein
MANSSLPGTTAAAGIAPVGRRRSPAARAAHQRQHMRRRRVGQRRSHCDGSAWVVGRPVVGKGKKAAMKRIMGGSSLWARIGGEVAGAGGSMCGQSSSEAPMVAGLSGGRFGDELTCGPDHPRCGRRVGQPFRSCALPHGTHGRVSILGPRRRPARVAA